MSPSINMAERRNDSESFASLFEQSSGAVRGKQRRYHTGEQLEVTVVAIAREAVFADLGGKQEGIFERSDLVDEEGHLFVEVGSRISAVVAGVDNSTGQVRLSPVAVRAKDDLSSSMASTTAIPTSGKAAPLIAEGARVKGNVTGIERYGVFVQIAGTGGRSGRGLVPTSETGTPRGADLKKHFVVGQEVEAKILQIDETGKIRLSIQALKADEERGEFEAFARSERSNPADPKSNKAAQPRGFGTLGDLLQKSGKKR